MKGAGSMYAAGLFYCSKRQLPLLFCPHVACISRTDVYDVNKQRPYTPRPNVFVESAFTKFQAGTQPPTVIIRSIILTAGQFSFNKFAMH